MTGICARPPTMPSDLIGVGVVHLCPFASGRPRPSLTDRPPGGGHKPSQWVRLVTMRQTHAAGERMFVDYAGDGVPVIIDRLTGEIRMAQIFVAVLGASSFTFAKASWTQALPDWIDAHVRAFEAIGGVPELVVPDNARTAIVKASFYEPEVNRTYGEMAAHYGTAVLPARPRKPRDKAKVEQAVLIVERWLLGRLRRRIFHSLADVDAALAELMTQLNERQPLRRLGVTRRQLLEEIDRPALKDLPGEPYEYSEWRVRRVGVDYHVDIDAHYYSVPYRFARAEVEARLTARGVEIFHKGERIAVHLRSSGNRKHTTVPEHMPSSHRRYAGWTIERIREDARKIGPATAALCEQILEARPHPRSPRAQRASHRTHRREPAPRPRQTEQTGLTRNPVREKLSRPTCAAPRAGLSRYRGAASSRNPWAQSSRFRRAASSESASRAQRTQRAACSRSGRTTWASCGASCRRIRKTMSPGRRNDCASRAIRANAGSRIADVCDRRASELWWSGHAPTRHHKLALAVRTTPDNRSRLVGEDSRKQRQVAGPIVLDGKEVADR